MWMIANRLSALDPEIHIRDSAPIILRSARRAYATNCVHVFQVGKDAICNGRLCPTERYECQPGFRDYTVCV